MTLPIVDTRHLFRPLAADLVTVLRSLDVADFERPTVAGSWRVRDVLAHIVDVSGRRLSFHRDRMPPPPPDRAINSGRDFLDFINALNARWISAAERFSPRVLTDMAEKNGRDLADWFEALSLDAPALFGVSWAGERESAGWFDVGREFVELWHHQQQIRLAVGAPLLVEPKFLRPVLALAVRGIPPALQDVGRAGDTLFVEITGDAGGSWLLTRDSDAWSIAVGATSDPSARARMSDDTAWRLLLHMLPGDDARARVHVTGRADLGAALLSARAVIV